MNMASRLDWAVREDGESGRERQRVTKREGQERGDQDKKTKKRVYS